MRCLAAVVAGVLATACSPVPVGTRAVSSRPVSVAAVPGSSVNAVPLTKVIRLSGPGAPTLLTVRAPANARHSFEAGEDSQRHTIVADGARVTFEYWIRQPTYACQSAACGRTVVSVDGQPSTFIDLPGGLSFVAFIPRGGDQAGRGVSVVGTCSSVQACSLARRIVMTLKFV